MPKTPHTTDSAKTGYGHNTPIASGQQPASPGRLQRFGTVRFVPIGLSEQTRVANVEALNQILADSISMRDLYKKCHWQVAGPTFYQLHLLFDKHYAEQINLVDAVAERVQTLGGVAVAMAHDVAEHQTLGRVPIDSEEVPTILTRLVEAHLHILMECRTAAKTADQNGDVGTNDLLVSELIRTNEMQSWFVNEHRIAMKLTSEGMTYETSRVEAPGAVLHS